MAERAAAAIKVSWKETPQPSNAEIFDYLKAHSKPSGIKAGDRGTPASDVWNAGSVEQGLAAAQQKLSQTYTVRYIAHCPLEPRAAVAEWKDDQLTVWMATQRPFGVRTEIAKAFRMPEEKVCVDCARVEPGVWRQAYGRARHRGRPPGAHRQKASKAHLVARRGIPVGVFQARRRAGSSERRRQRRKRSRPGNSTITTPATRRSARPIKFPTSATNFTWRIRRCGRALIAVWRRRPTISPARRTWTNSRA